MDSKIRLIPEIAHPLQNTACGSHDNRSDRCGSRVIPMLCAAVSGIFFAHIDFNLEPFRQSVRSAKTGQDQKRKKQ